MSVESTEPNQEREQENPRRVTMKDIARHVGVSQATVSRALRDDHRIKNTTRDKIRKAGEELGYRPDPTMAALASYRQNTRKVSGDHGTIVLLDIRLPGRNMDPSLREGVQGIQSRVKTYGYQLEIIQTSPKPAEQRRLSSILYNRGIRGVIVGPMPYDHARLDHFNWKPFAAVAHGITLESPLLDYVDIAQRVELAYNRFRELGYSRIGYCAPLPHRANYRYEKLASYLKCLFLNGIKVEDSPPMHYERLDNSVVRWIRKHRFDALLTGDAQGLIHLLEGTEFASRRKLGVATLSMSSREAEDRNLCGCVYDAERLGAESVDLLHRALCNSRFGIPQHRQAVIIEHTWQKGATIPNRVNSDSPTVA